MQQSDLKRLKEDFVSNLHGTTKWEVFCIVSCLPLCLLIGESGAGTGNMYYSLVAEALPGQ